MALQINCILWFFPKFLTYFIAVSDTSSLYACTFFEHNAFPKKNNLGVVEYLLFYFVRQDILYFLLLLHILLLVISSYVFHQDQIKSKLIWKVSLPTWLHMNNISILTIFISNKVRTLVRVSEGLVNVREYKVRWKEHKGYL